MLLAWAMAMAIRGHRRAKEIVLVRMHVGDMEKTPAEPLVWLDLVGKCIDRFGLRRSDPEGEEEGGEKAQHDYLAPGMRVLEVVRIKSCLA